MSNFIMNTMLLTIFISFLSINLSSVAKAARLPGEAYIWYADTLRAVERPGHSPPPYPKPAPPVRNAVVASNLKKEESDGNIERPRHPPPSYPKPAPPHRDAILSADQLSVLASAYFNNIMATI